MCVHTCKCIFACIDAFTSMHANVKYVDKESVGISPEVYLYIIISRLA